MFDAFFLQGIKNILVVVAAMQMVYVGYLLYRLKVSNAPTSAQIKNPLMILTINGTGPGIVAMGLGAAILIMALQTTVSTADQTSGSSFGGTDWVPSGSEAESPAQKKDDAIFDADLEPGEIANAALAGQLSDSALAEVLTTLANESPRGWTAFLDDREE